MKKKFCVVTLGMFLFFSVTFYFIKIRPDNSLCHKLLMQSKKNDDFYTYLTQLSQKKGWTWKDRENKYTIFFDKMAQQIDTFPVQYLSDALKVISYADYDESQKVYTIIMMQHLPIKEYMCFMDVTNTAFKQHVITDKDVVAFALHPDFNVRGTSMYYWWLPDWRERFKENADELFSQREVDNVLSGRRLFSDPYF